MKAYGQTDIGLKRKNNQDAILVAEDIHLYAVADGMGGHKGGEVASQMSLKVAEDFFRANQNMDPRALTKEMYRRACEKVYDESQIDQSLSGMGTTLVLAFLRDTKVYFGNVGDSRVYMFKNNRLWQITDDHSLLNEQVRAGLIEEDNADHFEGKNVITRSVGFERVVENDFLERDIDSNESYILCSDGLHGLISNEEILQVCRDHPLEKWPEMMINKAKEAGGDDNVSVVAFSVEVSS